MGKRIVLAGILAGIVVFAWGALSHMVLGLGETGIKQIPNEDTVLATMKGNIIEPGFYFFPWGDESTPEGMKQWEEKYKRGPIGVLIYQPAGRTPMGPGQLGTELGIDIVAALIAAALLAQAAAVGFGGRLLFVVLLGLFGAVATNISYWNWYGFPTDYTLAVVADEIIGWTLAGLVLAGIVKSS